MFVSAVSTHLVPVDVGEEQDPALWGARLGRRGRRNRRFGNLWQADVPRCINVKLATGRAHQHCTRLTGPQEGLLQGPDEVIPEELGDFSTHALVSQMQTDARLAHRIRHSLFVCVALTYIKQNRTQFTQSSERVLSHKTKQEAS